MINTTNEFKKAFEIIKKSSTVAIVGHVSPDGDCIGCGIAFKLALENKIVDVFYDAKIMARQYSYLADYAEIKTTLDTAREQYDVLIILDLNSIDRMGCFDTLIKNAGKVICFDHHRGFKMENVNAAVIDHSRPACAELVYEFFNYCKIKITKPIADALYTAVASDTGCFLYPSTTPRTHEIAAELIKHGADVETINYNNFRVYDNRLNFALRNVLKNLRFYCDGKIAVSILKKRHFRGYYFDHEEKHRLKKYLADVRGVVASAFFTIEGDKTATEDFRVSLRSHGDYDTESIARAFGGGGHKNASGFSIKGRYKKAVQRVVAEMEKQLLGK
jgi:phosphoesterase RecJ-like protein